MWRIRVSIPVPPACEAGALPVELIPRDTPFSISRPDCWLRRITESWPSFSLLILHLKYFFSLKLIRTSETTVILTACNLQRLPKTRDLSPSKDSDKAAFWWTSIIEKPLKLFWILRTFQGNRTKKLTVFPLTDGKLYESWFPSQVI